MEEQKRLIAAYNREGKGYPIEIVEGDYEPGRFYETARGYEKCPEGGERCFRCYELRLRETAERAAAGGYDYFTTTLTISPLKNAAKLNEIGNRLSGSIRCPGCPLILRRKTAISVLWNCLRNMTCTDRIIAVVFFPKIRYNSLYGKNK